MSYSYSFAAGARSHKTDQAFSVGLYREKAMKFTTQSDADVSKVFPDASKYSLHYLNEIKPICSRIQQEKLNGGFFKAEGTLLFNNEFQFKVGVQCDKDYVYSYFQAEGKDLVSTTQSSYDAAVNDFLSYLASPTLLLEA